VPPLNVLSIQSHVAYGHVGNDSATFAMQRLGVEVWPIHTVQFSNHTGYGAWTGQTFDPAVIGELLDGIEARGVLGRCDGVLSGYLGAPNTAVAVLDAVTRVRGANPAARYCCDPVMGDVGRDVFVHPDIPALMRARAIPAADIATPNHFELDLLTERPSRTVAEVADAIAALQAMGPRVVLVTSVVTEDTPGDAMDLVIGDGTGMWRVRTPRLDLTLNGAGDAVAGLVFRHLLRGSDPAAALARVAGGIYGVLAATEAAGTRELQLVAAQEELVAPTRAFDAEPLRP